MKPHAVEIGERYGDDSGWERLVRVDTQTGRFTVELQGLEMSGSTVELDWLINALSEARKFVV